MRKLGICLPLSLTLAFGVSARQHPTVAVAAPPVVMHPTPVGLTATSHIAPMRTPSSVRSGSSHGTPVPTKPVTTRRSTNSVPPPPPPTPVLGGSVNSVASSETFCNRHGNLPGLNACVPTHGVVLPFSGGAIYVPVPYYADYSAPQEEGAVQEQAAANQQPDSGTQDEEQQQAPAAAPSRYRASSNDINESLSEFVFVQRDGSKFYAVAYSYLNDKLQYVTKEGVRRSVALDSVDFDATQKLNEDLGTTINLPTPLASGVALSIPPSPLR
jgi:hypothetical protein